MHNDLDAHGVICLSLSTWLIFRIKPKLSKVILLYSLIFYLLKNKTEEEEWKIDFLSCCRVNVNCGNDFNLLFEHFYFVHFSFFLLSALGTICLTSTQKCFSYCCFTLTFAVQMYLCPECDTRTLRLHLSAEGKKFLCSQMMGFFDEGEGEDVLSGSLGSVFCMP